MSVNELKLCMGCMSPLMEDGKCSVCGYDPDTPPNLEYLPPETVLGNRYLVGRMVSADPEGTWYVGYDKQEQMRTWIREYFPSAISRRNHEDFSIHPLGSSEAQYKALMSDFEDLCRTLRSLPTGEKVLPLLNMLHANNTVYAIYRYIKTISLENFLRRSGGKLSWRHTKKLLMPLYHTMANVHRFGLIHRGLSPQTIHLDQSGNLWVSCFSIPAARTNKSEISAQLFEGYAAPEQYSLNSWQGPWTDVYALGAITYHVLTGNPPPSALDRVYGDDLLEPDVLEGDLTEQVVHALNRALAVEVEDRTQSVDAFITDLLNTGGSNTAIYNAPPRRRSYVEQEMETDQPQEVPGSVLPKESDRNQEDLSNKKKRERNKKTKKEKRSHPVLMLILSAFVATMLLGGAVYWFSTTYLGDLLWGDGSSQQSSSEIISSGSGEEFSLDEQADPDLVPQFVGMTRTSVESNEDLRDRFVFRYEEEYNTDYDEGVIYDQSPLEGSEIPSNGVITLYVSKGPERVPLPNLVGVPLEDAIRQLETSQISYQVIPRYDRDAEENVVLETDPAEAGTLIDTGNDTVILYIKMVEASISDEEGEEDEEEDRSSSSSRHSSSSRDSDTSSSRKPILLPPRNTAED